jgi:hypothetical protein
VLIFGDLRSRISITGPVWLELILYVQEHRSDVSCGSGSDVICRWWVFCFHVHVYSIAY